jgi:hypothetical protein
MKIVRTVLFDPQIKMKSVKITTRWGATTNSSPRPPMEGPMFRLFTSAMVLTVAVVGEALASAIPAVPAPEIGGGILGAIVVTGVVYLINRRRSRS